MNRSQKRAQKNRRIPVTVKRPASLLFCVPIRDMLLSEHSAVLAFRGGWAESTHFDMLLECMMMMQFAANDDKRENPAQDVLDVCDFASTALLNIRDRYDERTKLGATGDELRTLDLLVATSADFWPRQAATTYQRAYDATGEWKRSAFEQARKAA